MNLLKLQGTQKSFAFLCTNNERPEREIKETISYIITSKRIKCCRITHLRRQKILYSENYKILMKSIKDDTNRWRVIPYSLIGRLNIVKMTIAHKAIYRFNAIPIKFVVVQSLSHVRLFATPWTAVHCVDSLSLSHPG